MANTKQPVDWGGLPESKIQEIKEANAKSRARREAANKALTASYEKRKAELEAQHPNLKKYGGSESAAAHSVLLRGELNSDFLRQDQNRELLNKYQRENEINRLRASREATLAAQKEKTPKFGSNGMNSKASAITSSASKSIPNQGYGFKKGGKLKKSSKAVAVKKYAKGGSVKSSASSRGDGIAQRGKTKGRIL